jgi:hypothetical protein
MKSPTEVEVSPVQPPPPKLNQTESVRPSPYPNPYPNTSILRTGISYSSTSVPYERYPSHIRTFADHRRRRPSARSPLPLSNCHRRCKTVRRGHRKIVLRVSSETIKTVRRPTQDSPAADTGKSGAIIGAARQSGTGIAR